MKKITANQILNRAISTYGNTIQTAVACEELAELIQALTKMVRGNNDKTNLVEEIADVHIILEEIRRMYDVTKEEIDNVCEMKLIRLAYRLGMDKED